jgi:hypothetical protein
VAQDGSGTASAFLGSGKILAAKLSQPDKIGMMQKMAKMDMKRTHALKYRPKKDERLKLRKNMACKYGYVKEDPAKNGHESF